MILHGVRFSKFYYENEEVNTEENNNTEETNNNNNNNNNGKVIFTTEQQEHINKMLAEEKRRGQRQNEKTIKELQDLKKNAQLTTEQKDQLEQRIEDLRNEYLSKEEIAKKEAKKIEKEAKEKEEKLAKDRDTWKEKYHASTIKRELLDACAPDAYNPNQVVNLLIPHTRLVDELDDQGQPTGELVPKVKIAGKDKDGKTVIFDLSPTDAIKQMKEMEEHGNLFKSGAKGGFGGNNNPSVRGNSGGPPLNDPAAYRQWRRQNSGMRQNA